MPQQVVVILRGLKFFSQIICLLFFALFVIFFLVFPSFFFFSNFYIFYLFSDIAICCTQKLIDLTRVALRISLIVLYDIGCKGWMDFDKLFWEKFVDGQVVKPEEMFLITLWFLPVTYLNFLIGFQLDFRNELNL